MLLNVTTKVFVEGSGRRAVSQNQACRDVHTHLVTYIHALPGLAVHQERCC